VQGIHECLFEEVQLHCLTKEDGFGSMDNRDDSRSRRNLRSIGNSAGIVANECVHLHRYNENKESGMGQWDTGNLGTLASWMMRERVLRRDVLFRSILAALSHFLV
jgi:hypothetical protein